MMSTLVTAGQELIGIATLCGASLESRECVEEVPAGVCAHRRARSSWSDWSRPRQPGLASWGLVWAASLLPGSRVPLCGSNSRSPSSTRDIMVDSRRALLPRLVRLLRGWALLSGCLSSRENGGSRSADSSAAVALLAVTAHPPEGTQAHSSAGSQASFADRQIQDH